MTDMELFAAKIDDLDRRVKALEAENYSSIWDKDRAIAEDLIRKHGEYVDKTQTASILGVTRATVYAMLADGRLEGACNGKKVTVVSIARYLAAPKSSSPTKKGGIKLAEDPESVD